MGKGKAFVLSSVCSFIALICGYGIGFRAASLVFSPVPEQAAKDAAVPGVSRSLPEMPPYRYPVEKVLRVVDGDTMDVRFPIWKDIVLVKRLRLLGVDTPELHPRKGTDAEKAAEKQSALAALEYVQKIIDKASSLYVVSDWRSDSFGRILAGIRYVDQSGTEKDLGAELLKSGHAKPYKK